MTASNTFKSKFLDQTFDLLGRTLHASCFAFYSVDPEYNLYDFVCARVPDELHCRYVREMHQIDPLHVRRVAANPNAVVRMDEAPGYMPSKELVEYTQFMRRYDIIDNIDLILRHNNEIKAGLSVMWTSCDRGPTTVDFRLAEDLQPYIQFNLFDLPLAVPVEQQDRAIDGLHLTPRETDVAKLICAGRTNADIAACLGIGVSTVKTHLIHVFEKIGVESRSGLVARLAQFC